MKCQIQFVLQCALVLQIEIEHKYECMYKVFRLFNTSAYAIELLTLHVFYGPIHIQTLNHIVDRQTNCNVTSKLMLQLKRKQTCFVQLLIPISINMSL